LFAPFIILYLKKFQSPMQAAGLFLIGTGALCWLHSAYPDSFLTYDFGNLRMLFEFVMGIGMYYLYVAIKDSKANSPNTALFDWLFILVTLTAIATIQFSSLENYYLINTLIWIIPFAALSKQFIASFLIHKPFFYLGEISYSLYLVHLVLISMLTEPLKPFLSTGGIPAFFLFLLICTLISVLVAHFAYQKIEIPARDWIRKLSIFRKQPLPAATS
jgi:peptidoglycan/LPS O-acetylase OafA/YrhL